MVTTDDVTAEIANKSIFNTATKSINTNERLTNSDDVEKSTFHTLFQCLFELLLAYNASTILKGH